MGNNTLVMQESCICAEPKNLIVFCFLKLDTQVLPHLWSNVSSSTIQKPAMVFGHRCLLFWRYWAKDLKKHFPRGLNGDIHTKTEELLIVLCYTEHQIQSDQAAYLSYKKCVCLSYEGLSKMWIPEEGPLFVWAQRQSWYCYNFLLLYEMFFWLLFCLMPSFTALPHIFSFSIFISVRCQILHNIYPCWLFLSRYLSLFSHYSNSPDHLHLFSAPCSPLWKATLIISLYLSAPRTTMVDFVNDFLVLLFYYFPLYRNL